MLIRPQVLAEAQFRRYGRAHLRVPLPHVAAATALCGLFAALVWLGFTTTYTERTQAPGYLVPDGGIVRVRAPRHGVIVEVLVNQGDVVSRGDAIARIDSDARLDGQRTRSNATAANLERRGHEIAAQRAIDDERHRTESERLARERTDHALEVAAVDRQIEAQARWLDIARDRLARLGAAARGGAVAAAELLRLESDVAAGEVHLGSLERTRIALAAELDRIDLRRRDLAAEAASRRSSLALAELELEARALDNDAERTGIVVAPVHGRIVHLAARAGAETEPGRELAIVAAEGSRVRAELFLPAETIGLVRVGATVALRYDAFPYQAYGVHPATVREISEFVVDRRDIEVELGLRGSVFRVVAEPRSAHVDVRGRRAPLRPGMTLRADIALREMRLFEWLLEPLLALRAAPFRR